MAALLHSSVLELALELLDNSYLNCEHNDGSDILPVGSVKMSAGRYTRVTVTVQGCEI